MNFTLRIGGIIDAIGSDTDYAMIRIQETFEVGVYPLFFLYEARTWSALDLRGNFKVEISN